MMETGRAQVSALDDAPAYAQVAMSKTPTSFVVGTRSLELAPYGMVLPKDDPEFEKAVDAAVTKLMKSGQVAELCEKYITAPIPPPMINLNYPMSDALEHAEEPHRLAGCGELRASGPRVRQPFEARPVDTDRRDDDFIATGKPGGHAVHEKPVGSPKKGDQRGRNMRNRCAGPIAK